MRVIKFRIEKCLSYCFIVGADLGFSRGGGFSKKIEVHAFLSNLVYIRAIRKKRRYVTIGGRFNLNSWIAFCYSSQITYNLFPKPIFLAKEISFEFLNRISSGRVMYLQKLS